MGQLETVMGRPTWVDDAGGDSRPVLFLHGGLMSSETSWGAPSERSLTSLLGSDYRAILFDRRGHGRTPDTEDAFHFSDMALEAAAVVEKVGAGSVDVVGYSDGGIVAIHLALARPELIRSMVLISANYRADAYYPELRNSLEEAVSTDGYLAKQYGARSPDGIEHWPAAAAKGLQMAFSEPSLQPEQLAAIHIPTLVIAADDDQFPCSHTVSLYDALPKAQLAILPATSHLLVFEQPETVAALIRPFLERPARRQTLAPIRRPNSA